MKPGIIKKSEEIARMREGGELLSRVLSAVVDAVTPGVTTDELELIAQRVIREGGGEPSFLGYKTKSSDQPFPSALCTSINHEVVHGPAVPGRTLSSGDIVGLDIGVRYKGYCTDMAVTVPVGEVDASAERLMNISKEALLRGLSAIKPGNLIQDISREVQKHVEANGFGVVRELVGHGVGKDVHEEPRIPNYVDSKIRPVEIKEGMTLCIEPMVTMGEYTIRSLSDGWTFVTTDESLASHFEVTALVTKDGYEILTPLP